MIKYKKTDNPNIIKKIEIIENEIHLDKLEKEISELKAQLDNMPKPKTKPDQETLDYWNEMHIREDREELERQLKEKEGLLKQLKVL